ncbi:PREDICTED: uncharacterized protein K02A2.6-like [Priapulus caudatus]|uniref:Uncharacterized protein K02A2.6-like n=1 Tax=Priapulus caudatus TaxID=37621 RepID=A0ABM1F3A9_PRICU|nr:PREDICTED: uncharacterized protein K02A2.6-like [Priapulus caudatus]
MAAHIGVLRHEHIQKRLLSEGTLTLERAVEISVAMETASRDAAEVRGMTHASDDGYSEEPILHHSDLGTVKHSSPIYVHPRIEGDNFSMELDTGTSVSIISEMDYRNSTEPIGVNLEKSGDILRAYSGHQIKPIGKLHVTFQLNGQDEKLDLLVVPTDSPRLFGRDWLAKLCMNWQEVTSLKALSTNSSKRLESLVEKHKVIFQPGIGKLKNIQGSLTLENDAKPRFQKARTVPYAFRSKIEDRLQNLQQEDIIKPVKHSKWATPIVPAVKKNRQIRICRDYRMTLNPVMCVDKYPLPRIEDIFASLVGGQKFSKIDLTQAYHQMEMDEQSKNMLVINTHKGLFRYNRLVFGVSSAPSQWQRAIDQVLQNVPFTQCMLDDIIVSGCSNDEHLSNLKMVF